MSEIALTHKKERVAYIDVVKSICIFLMVVGHFSSNKIILSYIYSFHMPAFLIVSGYLYRPHSWKKTIIAFSFPVILFSLINLVVILLLGDVSINHLTFKYIFINIFEWRHGLCNGLFKGGWFIWVIVGLRLISGDILCVRLRKITYITITILISIYMTFEKYLISIDTLFHGYYIGKVIPSLPFFCVGLFLKDLNWTPQNLSIKLVIPLFLLFLFIPVTKNYCDIYNGDYGYSYLTAAFVATFFTLLLSWVTNKLPTSHFVETISKGTLVILGLHMSMLKVLSRVLPNSMDFLFPFITIVLCYYIIIFCEKHCPIMLGKVK